MHQSDPVLKGNATTANMPRHLNHFHYHSTPASPTHHETVMQTSACMCIVVLLERYGVSFGVRGVKVDVGGSAVEYA